MKLTIKNKYGVVPHEVLFHKDMSLKAKGLYGYLQSKPDGWKFSAVRIAKENKDGKDGVSSALQELERLGYLKREKFQNKKGEWDCDYTLYSTVTDYPSSEKPSSGKPSSEKPSIYKERDIKKDLEKKNNKQFNELLGMFEKVNPMHSQIFSNKTERRAMEELIDLLGEQKVYAILEKLPQIIYQPYAPKITKPTELKRDLAKLIAFVKQSESQNKYQVKEIY